VIARADDDEALFETKETNNTRSVVIKIGPDLVVSALSAPTSARLGAAITVTDTTKNQGGGATGRETVTAFYLSSTTAVDGSAVPLGQRTVPDLAAGATSAVSTPLTIPADATPGPRYIIAVANSGTDVTETSRTNNTRARAITISP
jgi:hypothetical protein